MVWQMTFVDEMEDELAESTLGRRICNEDECENFLPLDAHRFQRYCEVHARPARPKPGANKRTRTRRDAPPKVVIDLGQRGAKASSPQTKKVENGAKAALGLIGVGVTMMGDQVCGSAIAAGAADFGKALGELSKYQPIIAKIFAPASASDQAAAWLTVGMATLPILIPVLAHHKLLPAQVGMLLGGVAHAAAQPNPDSDGG